MHFITCSCDRRKPLLGTKQAREVFLKVLGEVRARFHFGLVGYVVMPEHVHLLITEPETGTPGTVMQVLKQRVARAMRRRRRRKNAAQLGFWEESAAPRAFWQKRFYDFNVWSRKKRVEKIGYMHMNPVKRKLVEHPKDWAWSSYRCYQGGGEVVIDVDWVE